MPLLGTTGEGSARAYGLYGGRAQIGLTIAANTYNYDVYTNRGPTYVAGSSDIVVTVNPGVTVGSTSTGTYALLVPSAFSPTDKITVVNNGVIQGMGGAAGNGGRSFSNLSQPGTPGAGGGSAIYVNRPVTITNNGVVAAGGGGGGGGAGNHQGTKTVVYSAGGGGGGGSGFNGGAFGAGGPSDSPPRIGGPGSVGTSPAGGAGGAAGGSGPTLIGGPGGSGGGRGAAGASGTPTARGSGGSGGPTGNYITGNPFVTWPVTGTRQGNVA